MSRGGQGVSWRLFAATALLLLVATASTATAKTGPAAGAAGRGSPLLATVDVGLDAGQDLDVGTDVGTDVASVELALEAPRSWTYLADLARFSEDAKWRLEKGVQDLAGGCVGPSARLKTRVRGYKLFVGGNEAVKKSLIPHAARDCDPSRTAGPMRGVFLTTDPLGYVDGPNLYQFALNNPVNYSDPMGEAVYVFDGTKNDRDVMSNPTNPAKLCAAFERAGETCHYLPGVGTGGRRAHEPKALGMGAGYGGQNRLDEMYELLEETYNSGDHEIVILGFSRGAALARDFANMINERGITDHSSRRMVTVIAPGRGGRRYPVYDNRFESPEIRFLGVFDTVGSFGHGGDDSNPGYDFSIPQNVVDVRHAVAANEYRKYFPLESIHAGPGVANTPSRFERYFRGAHSDIGGGYDNDIELSRVALQWMWQEIHGLGIKIGNLAPVDSQPVPPGAALHDSRWPNDRFKDWVTGRRNRPRTVFYHPPQP